MPVLLGQCRHEGTSLDLGLKARDRRAVERHDDPRKTWLASRDGWRLVIGRACRVHEHEEMDAVTMVDPDEPSLGARRERSMSARLR